MRVHSVRRARNDCGCWDGVELRALTEWVSWATGSGGDCAHPSPSRSAGQGGRSVLCVAAGF